jgi:hypothetical protein
MRILRWLRRWLRRLWAVCVLPSALIFDIVEVICQKEFSFQRQYLWCFLTGYAIVFWSGCVGLCFLLTDSLVLEVPRAGRASVRPATATSTLLIIDTTVAFEPSSIIANILYLLFHVVYLVVSLAAWILLQFVASPALVGITTLTVLSFAVLCVEDDET